MELLDVADDVVVLRRDVTRGPRVDQGRSRIEALAA